MFKIRVKEKKEIIIMKLGAIEAGGTKFVVCIGNEKGEVLERESFPT